MVNADTLPMLESNIMSPKWGKAFEVSSSAFRDPHFRLQHPFQEEMPSCSNDGQIPRVCVCMCHWMSLDSWRPCDGAMSIMFCPQQSCSLPVDLGLWLLLWSQSISYLSLLSLLHVFFPAWLSFPKIPAFSWCAQSKTASVLSVLPLGMFPA